MPRFQSFFYLIIFLTVFSLFFFPTLLYAQSTPWSFYNNSSQTNAMDIFYNELGSANPAVRISKNGNLTVTGLLSQQGAGNNFFTGNIGIGDPNPTSKLRVYDSKNISTAYTSTLIQLDSNSSADRSTVSHIAASVGAVANGGGTLGNLTGVQSTFGPNWGLVSNGYGFLAQPGFGSTNSQTMTQSFSFYAASPYFGNFTGSRITKQYGVYIADQEISNSSSPVSKVDTGYGIYQTGANDENFFNGKVGIGTSTPQEAFDVKVATDTHIGFSSFAGYAALVAHTDGFSAWKDMIIAPAGKVCFGCVSAPTHTYQFMSDDVTKPTAGQFGSNSDIRLKKNVQPFKGDALEKLTKLQGYHYSWINPSEHGNLTGEQTGFIAQQIEQIFPNWIKKSDPSGADKSLVSPGEKIENLFLNSEYDVMLVESIKQLKSQLDQEKIRNDLQEQEIQELKNSLSELNQHTQK